MEGSSGVMLMVYPKRRKALAAAGGTLPMTQQKPPSLCLAKIAYARIKRLGVCTTTVAPVVLRALPSDSARIIAKRYGTP